MKQRITIEQLNELSNEQKERLREWWKPQYGDGYFYPKVNSTGNVPNGYRTWELGDMKTRAFPLLSIGQMIEIIRKESFGLEITDGGDHWYIEGRHDTPELCDALWEAVKATL